VNSKTSWTYKENKHLSKTSQRKKSECRNIILSVTQHLSGNLVTKLDHQSIYIFIKKTHTKESHPSGIDNLRRFWSFCFDLLVLLLPNTLKLFDFPIVWLSVSEVNPEANRAHYIICLRLHNISEENGNILFTVKNKIDQHFNKSRRSITRVVWLQP
jgi:hypothetical protein